jgi:acetoin utilization protein AcuB
LIAKELISVHIPSISCKDSGEKALEIMDENRVSHLAVVEDGEYRGLISDNEIYDLDDDSLPLNEVKPNLTRPYVNGFSHSFEIIALLSEFNLSAIPVLDDKEQYLGVIAIQDLSREFTKITNANVSGGILILALNARDYSMAQVAQIIEDDNAKILSSYISAQEDSLKIELIIKINKTDLSSIIAAFNRYDYEVKASFHQSVHDEDLERRYEQFIKYLNI